MRCDIVSRISPRDQSAQEDVAIVQLLYSAALKSVAKVFLGPFSVAHHWHHNQIREGALRQSVERASSRHRRGGAMR